MIKISATVEFLGDNFKPGLAEKEGNFLFTEKNEVGDIGTVGSFKAKPIPFGSATLKAPQETACYERIIWLAKFLEGKIDLIRQCKADNIYFNIGYFHDGQCNCELSADEIKAIAKLGIPFCFSIYQVESLDEID